MDTIIQSLSQSAIVQKLSETENLVKRFTNDIPDNAPYRSFDKVEVQPFMGDRTDPDSDLYFKVPRRGYINRMYLKVKCRFNISPTSTEADFGARPRGPEFFAGFFDCVDLSIGGKHIETLYAENILYDVFKNSGGSNENMLYWLKGSHTDVGEIEMGDKFFDIPSTVDNPTLPLYANFIIPLNFSLFAFYKDAPDTTFLSKMEVKFKKRSMKGYQTSSVATTEATLVCKYHNLLNHFKTQIRNTNYPTDTTTLLTSSNHLVTTAPVVTQHLTESPTFGRHVYNLDLDMYVTDFLITFRKLNVAQAVNYVSEVYCSPSSTDDSNLKFILKVNGEVIFEKFNWEMHREENVSSHDIQDQVNMNQGHRMYRRRTFTGFESLSGSLYQAWHNPEARDYRSSPCMYRIPLSMFGTDEFLNGGLDMKSLKNVQLIVEGEALKTETDTQTRDGLTPQIVIRYKSLLRVDSKSGVVSIA